MAGGQRQVQVGMEMEAGPEKLFGAKIGNGVRLRRNGARQRNNYLGARIIKLHVEGRII